MIRGARHATKSAEESSVNANSNKLNTENRRPQRCNRSVVKLKSVERLKKLTSKLHRQKLTVLPRKLARIKKKLSPPRSK